jgi:arginine transport system substrate-binding protein
MFKFVVFLVGAAAFMSCSGPKAEGTLVVGLQADYPPYEYVDESGHVVGFDVAIAEKIAQAMGKKLIIQEMGFDALILSLKSHKIDLIISGMSITADRQNEIEMVPYQGATVTELQLIFWKAAGAAIENLKGKTIAAQTGTFHAEVLQRYPEVHPKLMDNTLELVMEIKYGKSDAALVETAVCAEFKSKHPEIESVVVPLSPEEQSLGNGIGIAKDKPELKAAVEKTIQELKESGQLQDLQRKWFHA